MSGIAETWIGVGSSNPISVLLLYSFSKPKSFSPSLSCLPLFPFLLFGRLFIKSPVFNFPEKTVLLQFTLQDFQCPFKIIPVDLNFQDCYLQPFFELVPEPKPPFLSGKPVLGCWGRASANARVFPINGLPLSSEIVFFASFSDPISTKPKPLDCPVNLSVIIFTDTTSP